MDIGTAVKEGIPNKLDMRAVVVLGIMALFMFNNIGDFWIAINYSKINPLGMRMIDTAQGAILTAFAAAWGYYLGNSSATALAREQVSRALALSPPPTTETTK